MIFCNVCLAYEVFDTMSNQIPTCNGFANGAKEGLEVAYNLKATTLANSAKPLSWFDID